MSISQISQAFEKSKEEKRPALLTYTVAGDNTKKKSLEILNAISKYADICELGFPHNTPIADGGQIQTASYRAIKNGIKMKDVFEIVRNFKKKNTKPLILMGYYNMIYQYGENNFLKKCKQVGVDGLIVVDLPWPDNKSFAKKCKKNSLKILNSIAKHADILELSFLHNCPIADGGQIQNSTYRALRNGTTLKDTFQIAKRFKKNNPNKPLILMGYYNLIYQNGENNFLKNCKLSKFDALIVVDLPLP